MKALIIISAFLISSTSLFAHEVKPIEDYLSDYKGKYTIILKAIETMPPDTPISDRLAFYDTEMGKLKASFKELRTKEYESKSFNGSVTNSCTSGSSGSVKNCGYAYTYAPNKDMYTTEGWTSVKGTNKGVVISDEGRSAGLKMTVAGRGRNEGTLTAIFKYHPDKITINVDRETAKLFNMVSQKS